MAEYRSAKYRRAEYRRNQNWAAEVNKAELYAAELHNAGELNNTRVESDSHVKFIGGHIFPKRRPKGDLSLPKR